MGTETLKQIAATSKKRMDETVASLKKSLSAIRTGRASVAILDGVRVNYYGQELPVNQVATLSVPDAGLIVVQPWDVAIAAEVEKAILKANLGLTPLMEGKVIRVPIPPLTEERRVEMVKKVRELCEERKTAIRHLRRDANERIKKAEKDKEISEDDLHRGMKTIQEQTDLFIEEIEGIQKAKEKELMEIA
jgi:ribosome recycling factor